jgi:hypothetical protein
MPNGLNAPGQNKVVNLPFLKYRLESRPVSKFWGHFSVLWKGGICSRIIILERSRAVSLLKGQCHNTFDLRFLKESVSSHFLVIAISNSWKTLCNKSRDIVH